MPLSHHKSKSKVSEKIATTMEIKIEPKELKPLGNYVDDRVELIKQTFESLKPKTIKSICPGFMEGKSIADIQEQCLDEVLGISKRRLLSIINATKCPTDTESSDNSDVEKIEEHISLDEISSDDDLIAGKSKNRKRKLAAKKNKASEKNGKAGTAQKSDKEVSVLELLELQARARAIRSQLALEPITKIELDSDDKLSSSTSSTDSKSKKTKKKSKKSSNSKDTENIGKSSTSHQSQAPIQPESRPIRLKRNFRKPDRDGDENDEIVVTEKRVEIKSGTASVKTEDKNKTESNDDDRCSSPDLIPVIPIPETLCISDSDDDKVEEIQVVDEEKIEETKKVDEPPEEGEIREELEKSNTEDQQNEDKSGETIKEDDATIITEDHSNKKSVEIGNPLEIDSNDEEIDTLRVDLGKEELDYEMKDSSSSSSSSSSDEHSEQEEPNTLKSPSRQPGEIETINLDLTDDDDDDPEPVKEEEEIRSFHDRWLESKKVSKILATSRLGNRVRGSIKSKKAAEKINISNEESNPSPQTVEDPIVEELSKYEEGSVKQWEVLTKNDDTIEGTDDSQI